MESKLLTRRMNFIISLLEEENMAMTIEEISDIGSERLDEKGICNQYTYNQVSVSVYGLYRRGLVELENIPRLENPIVFGKDTIVKLKEIKIQ